MGISSDTEELTEQIFKDEVKIGYGLGVRVEDESLVGGILNIDPQKVGDPEWDIHIAKGRAGKLYLIAKGPSGRNTAVQLHEQPFWEDNKNVQPEDIDEAFDEQGNLIDGKIPSIAEVAFRAVTRTINASAFDSYVSSNIVEELARLLVHASHKTKVSKHDASKMQYLARKQFWYDEEKQVLNIALSKSGDSNQYYSRTQVPISKLFGPESQPELRKAVIASIARNLHWNTEKDDLSENMVDTYPELFRFLNRHFDKSGKTSLFGLKSL
jgi:hypothetical protein